MLKIRRTLMLGLVAWLVAARLTAGEPTERYHASAAEYNQLAPTERYAWLQHLLIGRAEPAARVTLSPAAFRELQQRHREILDHAAAGRQLSNRGLARLLAQVDSYEQRAIEILRRDFAFRTAQAFHDNRAVFEKRNDAWRRIEQRWGQTGRDFSWQPRIIAWLARANSPRTTEQIARRPIAGANPQPPRRATAEVAPVRQSQTASGPQVDQGELLARIAGYNMALARMIAELHEHQHWTVLELDRAAGELGDLATTHADLAMYLQLVPLDEQKWLPALDSLQSAVSLLATRTATRRRQLETAETATSPDYAAWELRRLENVSRRLATLASARN